MSVFRLMADDLDTNGRLFDVGDFEQDPIINLTPRPDSDRKVFGHTKWQPGDRVGLRAVLQSATDANVRVNDRNMQELHPAGVGALPYEPVTKSRPVSREHSAAANPRLLEIVLCHQRATASVSKARLQPFQVFTIPAPTDPAVSWFCQGGGEWIAVHSAKGPMARLVCTTVYPRYGFFVPTMPGNSQHAEAILGSVLATGEVPAWYP